MKIRKMSNAEDIMYQTINNDQRLHDRVLKIFSIIWIFSKTASTIITFKEENGVKSTSSAEFWVISSSGFSTVESVIRASIQ